MTGIIRLVLLTFALIVSVCILPAASSAQQAANLANFLRMVEPAQVFPEANHWILKPEDSRFFYNEVHKWLAGYLGGR